MKSSRFDQLRPTLLSMGLAFYEMGEKQIVIDPEQAILDSIPLFFEDRKVFKMVLQWCILVSPLVHIERLRTLSEKLDQNSKIILGVMAKKLTTLGDRRWALVERKMRTDSIIDGSSFPVPEGASSEFLLQKYGIDPDFESFGIKIARIDPAHPKKLLTLPAIVERQSWLKLRALIGPNFRADLIYLLGTGRVENPNQASKIMGCSRAAASRLWKEIQLFPELSKVVA